MRNISDLRLILFILIIGMAQPVKAQLSPHEAGYLDAVLDYGADNTGKTVTTAALQNAIDAAASQKKALFIPAGTYLIDNTLECKNGTEREDPVVIAGSSVNPEKRTVIKLKAGTFTDAANPKPMIHNQGFKGYDSGFPDTFNRMLHSIDFKTEENNEGAIAVAWRGAEGCSLFDVHIDVTGGFAGINALLGSGGSTANLSVKGGKYGIYLASDATQPTPVITDARFEGQTISAIYSNSTRGPLTITGARFIMNNGVPVFSLVRHGGLTWSPGGNPVLTDCVIEYASQDEKNKVFIMNPVNDQSIFFMDVYVKNADRIVVHDETINSNPDGWRHFKKMAYNSGWNKSPQGDEPVYLDGVRQNEIVYQDYNDGEMPPADLQDRHGWGKTFPGFETPGAVNVKNYASHSVNGDWGPAFNAAIEDAASKGSNVVFVPAGEYITYSTINLEKETALVGVSHYHSAIFGRDDKNRRFGGSTSAWNDPRPMIQTPDDKMATCTLADLAVRVNGPFNGDAHTFEAMACYALLWRAGNNSVIRNINYMHKTRTNYRAMWAMVGSDKTSGLQNKVLNLRALPSPYITQGISFYSESRMSYHTSPELPSRLLLETIEGHKRIMPRSMPPAHLNRSENEIDVPNLMVMKEDSSRFNISSIKLTNAAWNPAHGDTLVIRETGEGTRTYKINLKDISRTALQTVDLNWNDVEGLLFTSNIPFSIDEIEIDGNNIGFEEEQGEMLKENTDWNHWFSGYPFMYLPMYYMAHPYVAIEGGCKYYNHWKHGSTWLHLTQPYILVQNNDPDDIVSFYHFHAQHSENFWKLKISNAHNVSMFGAKTENALEFVRVENSDNIRLFGHGGMTNPPKGTAHYRIENSTNWAVVSPTNEVQETDQCRNCGLGDAMLPATAFGAYDVIQEVEEDTFITPLQTDLPILYMRGEPKDPWMNAAKTFSLNTEALNGSVLLFPDKSIYYENEPVLLTAVADSGYHFTGWSGDASGNSNQIRIIIDDDKFVKASFEKTTPAVTYDHDMPACWPNPCSDILYISAPAESEVISVSNMLGQVVLRRNMIGNRDMVNLSELKSGIYFLRFEQSKTGSIKIVKI